MAYLLANCCYMHFVCLKLASRCQTPCLRESHLQFSALLSYTEAKRDRHRDRLARMLGVGSGLRATTVR